MIIGAQAIREFREAYLVANTPFYLYKRLRRLAAVEDLAKASHVSELVGEYLQRAKAERRAPEDMAIAYACLVALTYKEPQDSVPAFRLLDLGDLDWAPTIRELYFAKLAPVTERSVSIPTPSTPAPRLATDATASSATTEIPKPSVKRKADL